MLRKILGFLPAAWWGACIGFLFLVLRADFTEVLPWLWVWLGCSVASGVFLCFDGILLPAGLLIGFLTNAISCLVLFLDESTAGNRAAAILTGAFAFCYVLYFVCYITYHRETNK